VPSTGEHLELHEFYRTGWLIPAGGSPLKSSRNKLINKTKMKSLSPLKAMDLALKQKQYQGIPKKIRARYVALLVSRAVRFYIENELDSSVVDEDLADGKSDSGFYESGEPLKKTDLCNLIYSEKHEAKYQKSLRA